MLGICFACQEDQFGVIGILYSGYILLFSKAFANKGTSQLDHIDSG